MVCLILVTMLPSQHCLHAFWVLMSLHFLSFLLKMFFIILVYNYNYIKAHNFYSYLCCILLCFLLCNSIMMLQRIQNIWLQCYSINSMTIISFQFCAFHNDIWYKGSWIMLTWYGVGFNGQHGLKCMQNIIIITIILIYNFMCIFTLDW